MIIITRCYTYLTFHLNMRNKINSLFKYAKYYFSYFSIAYYPLPITYDMVIGRKKNN